MELSRLCPETSTKLYVHEFGIFSHFSLPFLSTLFSMLSSFSPFFSLLINIYLLSHVPFPVIFSLLFPLMSPVPSVFSFHPFLINLLFPLPFLSFSALFPLISLISYEYLFSVSFLEFEESFQQIALYFFCLSPLVTISPPNCQSVSFILLSSIVILPSFIVLHSVPYFGEKRGSD
jgi:hypothetical protein